jgi:uncharacterized membrane protein YfcA
LITDPAFYAVAIPAVLLAGVAKASGNGMGMVAVPLMALAVPPATAAAVMLPILIAMDGLGLWAWRGRADLDVLRTVLPGAMIGILVGALVFTTLDVRWVKAILGVESLLFALHRVLARHAIAAAPALPPTRATGTFWGAVSGFTSTLAHAGNPPLMQYLLPLKLDKERLVGTSVIFFTVVNLIKLVPYGLIGLFDLTGLGTSLALAPAIPVGYWAGIRLVKLLPERAFYRLLVGSLFLIGIKLCWDAVAS